MLMPIRRSCASSTISEIFLQVDAATPEFLVSEFLDWVVAYLEDGAEIADGQTLQYGFTLFRCLVQSGKLTLFAPDFRSLPVQWVDDLISAFQLIAAHKYVPESVALPADIPWLQQTAIVGERFEELPMFANRAERSESNKADSGWFIGSQSADVDNNNPETLRVMSLYEAIILVPQLIPFLSLPAGCSVLFSEGDPVILRDWVKLEIDPESYLGRLNRQSRFDI